MHPLVSNKVLCGLQPRVLSLCSLLLDGERWKQADVPAEIQCLAHTLEAGIYD